MATAFGILSRNSKLLWCRTVCTKSTRLFSTYLHRKNAEPYQSTKLVPTNESFTVSKNPDDAKPPVTSLEEDSVEVGCHSQYYSERK